MWLILATLQLGVVKSVPVAVVRLLQRPGDWRHLRSLLIRGAISRKKCQLLAGVETILLDEGPLRPYAWLRSMSKTHLPDSLSLVPVGAIVLVSVDADLAVDRLVQRDGVRETSKPEAVRRESDVFSDELVSHFAGMGIPVVRVDGADASGSNVSSLAKWISSQVGILDGGE